MLSLQECQTQVRGSATWLLLSRTERGTAVLSAPSPVGPLLPRGREGAERREEGEECIGGQGFPWRVR